MSVLIKGMEMPTGCEDCPMAFAVNFGILCTPTKRIVGDGEISKKQGFCPLIPVPEPHGRLGDLDELAKQTEYGRYHHTHTNGLAARHHIAEYGHFLKEIADTPTIIPASEEAE